MTKAPITATIVPEASRMRFIPDLVGNSNLMRFEGRVYSWMGRFCSDYIGGYWQFVKLSNGSGFMYLDNDDDNKVTLFNSMNEAQEEVSPQAAGMVVTLMALQLTYEDMTSARGLTAESDRIVERMDNLKDYIYQHEEHPAILALID